MERPAIVPTGSSAAVVLDDISERLVASQEMPPAWVRATVRECIDRCMQAEEIKDDDGLKTGVWKFDATNALRGLDMAARFAGLYDDHVRHDHQVSVLVMPQEIEP